jgi:hypothetical protein
MVAPPGRGMHQRGVPGMRGMEWADPVTSPLWWLPACCWAECRCTGVGVDWDGHYEARAATLCKAPDTRGGGRGGGGAAKPAPALLGHHPAYYPGLSTPFLLPLSPSKPLQTSPNPSKPLQTPPNPTPQSSYWGLGRGGGPEHPQPLQ